MPRTPPTAGTAFVKADAVPNALVAAAIPVTGTQVPRTRKTIDSWQREAWEFHDTVGALRFAANWYSNACSKARLVVGELDAKGALIPDTDGPAWEALQELKRSFGSEAELLKALAIHDFIAGECYLVGMPPGKLTDSDKPIGPTGNKDDVWIVASVEELQKKGGGDTWTVDWHDQETITLDDNDTVLRLWTPSPRRRWFADSPVKAALPDLREIRTASRHISAQMYSRLAGAGVLLVPNEVAFAKPANTTVPDGTAADPNADPLMVTIGTTMMASIDDPGSVAAFVPIILKVPGEYVDKIKHLNFWADLDEKALEIRRDGIKNLATTLDMPAEVLLGTADMNHWGAWQVDESAVKTHIEPGLGRITTNLTLGYLRQLPGMPSEKVFGFDSSTLRLRPNRSKEALELYDRGELNGDALRRETGFEDADGYKDDEDGFNRWLLKKCASGSATPEMVAYAMDLLTKGKVKPPTEDQNNRQARPDPSLVDHPTQGPPEPDEAQTASLMATSEAMIYRAMERAGSRMRNKYDVRPTGIPADELYLTFKARPEDFAVLLQGAWNQLPKMLHRTDYDAATIAPALDAYARSLLLSQAKYDPDAMQRHLFRALGKS